MVPESTASRRHRQKPPGQAGSVTIGVSRFTAVPTHCPALEEGESVGQRHVRLDLPHGCLPRPAPIASATLPAESLPLPRGRAQDPLSGTGATSTVGI
jgi:hypothetical protein